MDIPQQLTIVLIQTLEKGEPMKKFMFIACGFLLCLGNSAFGDIRGFESPLRIDGEYIVVFKDAPLENDSEFHSQTVSRLEGLTGGIIGREFRSALNGVMFYGSEADVKVVVNDPAVEYVEANQVISLSKVSWGLDRIDSEEGLDRRYKYRYTGDGVHAYVIDTGVFSSHKEFSNRMGDGYNSIDSGDAEDCNGHGTHVAGTIGGTEYGVAKDVIIHGVRVLGCRGNGSIESVVGGIDWVAENHIAPAVANMSLGGAFSAAINDAVKGAVASGVTFVVAAGNDSGNACNYSPASTFEAITVGATDKRDRRANFSNHGGCVDIFAPGVDIPSAWIGKSSETNTISGTSMASPHVAGVVALYLEDHPDDTPAEMKERIVQNANSDKVSDVLYKSPNLLLYSAPKGSKNPKMNGPLPKNPCGVDCEILSGNLSSGTKVLYEMRLRDDQTETIQAYLRSPVGADFDLELQEYRGIFRGYVKMEISDRVKGDDKIDYQIKEKGRYRLVAKTYFGSGDYTFWIKTSSSRD